MSTPTVLTSNKRFQDWGEIFGDEVIASALIDGLVHHCHIVNIRGNGHRIRRHRELQRLPTHSEAAPRRPMPRLGPLAGA
jgi:DNA replication protein DnaC